jgi:hypothetical protein
MSSIWLGSMFLSYPQPMNPIHLSSLHLTISLLVFQLPSKVAYTKKIKITDCGEGVELKY